MVQRMLIVVGVMAATLSFVNPAWSQVLGVFRWQMQP